MLNDELNALIDILEISVLRNGEIALTNKHLLNILKMADRKLTEEAQLCEEAPF